MYFRLTSADSEGRHIMKFRKTYKRKQAAVLLSVFLLVTSVAGCQRVGAVKETGEEKVNVVTTIFPQYDFVRQIAGDNVEVSMLLKPGEETHSYEPTPQDILKIQNCDLFIYVGGENDEWVEDILDSIDTEHILSLIHIFNFFEISNCMFKSYCLHQSLPVYYNIQKENYSHRLFCYDVLKSKRIILQSKRGE